MHSYIQARGSNLPRAFFFWCVTLGGLALLVWQPLVEAAGEREVGGVGATAVTPISYTYYLPYLHLPPLPVPLPPPVPFSGTVPIDFTAVRAQLQAQGLDLAFSKFGFHAGPGGNPSGLVTSLTQLDAAGVPFVVKSVDTLTGVYEAQMIMRQSSLPHVTIFRRSIVPPGELPPPSGDPDVPDYDKLPEVAAAEHWAWHKQHFPPELDPALTWVETINEVDRNRSAWLALFALETAKLAMADGYKWAAFGWATGNPEPEHWESPEMLAFLRFAAAHPDRVAIALHEYSLELEPISNLYPYLVGRFQFLFMACDRHNIARPTVLFTEWGWQATHVPDVDEALEDLAWASWLYAAYPQVKGAAIWYLGPGFGGIADEAQKLIAPLTAYQKSHYFGITPGQGRVEPGLFVPVPPTGAGEAAGGTAGY
ncbi:MAG: hypothetical protein KC425_08920 [Anaerolineales bacterium]|nr:hypothetical protein [Anaerolineales bacterium]